MCVRPLTADFFDESRESKKEKDGNANEIFFLIHYCRRRNYVNSSPLFKYFNAQIITYIGVITFEHVGVNVKLREKIMSKKCY